MRQPHALPNLPLKSRKKIGPGMWEPMKILQKNLAVLQ